MTDSLCRKRLLWVVWILISKNVTINAEKGKKRPFEWGKLSTVKPVCKLLIIKILCKQLFCRRESSRYSTRNDSKLYDKWGETLRETNWIFIRYDNWHKYKQKYLFIVAIKKKLCNSWITELFLYFAFFESGPDGTRTRDPMRDRHVF